VTDRVRASRREFLRGTGGLAMLGALAACGSNHGGAAGSSGGGLAQWYHAYGEKGTEQAAKRYAAAYPKAKVSVRWIPGQYVTALSSGLLGSSGPDVFEDQLNVELVHSKEVVPLDDVLGLAKSDFVDAALATNTVDGRIYGIPMVEDMQLLYYRKSLLKKARVAPPTTLDELAEVAKALTTKDVKGLFLGNFVDSDGSGNITPLGGPVLWSAGLDLLSTDGSSAGFDDPRAGAAIDKLRSLYGSGHLLLGAPTDWSDPSAFTQGLAAMQWSGLWAMPAVQAKFGDDFGVLPFPKLDGKGDVSVPIGTYAAMVNAKSVHQDEAKDFIKWLWVDKTDYQEDFNLSYGFHLPPRKSIAAQASKLKTGAAADAVSYSTQHAHPASPPLWTPVMSTAYQGALTNIIKKNKDSGQELATAAATVQKELKRLAK
jgi:multiple sugar transport system substrate-binding protein